MVFHKNKDHEILTQSPGKQQASQHQPDAGKRNDKDVCAEKKDELDLIVEFARRFLRGFTSGVCLQAGISFLGGLRRKSFKTSLLMSILDIFSKKSLKTSAFLGLFPSIYHFVLYLIRRRRKTKDGWNCGMAGGVAGLSVAILDADRREFLTFFSLSRSVAATISTLVSKGLLPVVPHFDAMTFIAVSSVVIYCTFLHPEYMDPGYYRSIVSWTSDYTDDILRQIGRDKGTKYLSCEEVGLHSGSCLRKRFLDWFYRMPSFVKIYLPVYLIPAALFKRKAFVKNPTKEVKDLIVNLFLSSSFLNSMMTVGMLSICWFRHIDHKPSPMSSFVPLLAGFFGSFSIFIERPGRRKELLLFVLQQAFQFPYYYLKTLTTISKRSAAVGFTLLFSFVMTSALHAYEAHPASLTSLMTFVVRFLIGDCTLPKIKF